MNKITGFTPASDYLCKEYNPLMALVYGKVYRYTDWGGECSASQSRIAEELGVSVATVARRLKLLEQDGYIKRLKSKIGLTVVYVPTGKIAYKTEVSETIGTSESDTPSITEQDLPTSESKTKIVLKKDKETTPTEKKELSPLKKAQKELETFFASSRGCQPPDWSIDPRGLNKTWSTPLGNIWKKCGKDTEAAERVIKNAVTEMMKDELTFSMPVQIIKKVDSLLADMNKPKEAMSQREIISASANRR